MVKTIKEIKNELAKNDEVKIKYSQMPSDDIVEATIVEIESAVVAKINEARESVIGSFWYTGEIIRMAEKDHKVSVSALIARVAEDNRMTGRQMGDRNLWFALKLYDTYPDFDSIFEIEGFGQNISLTKLKKMLVKPKEKKEPTIEDIALKIFDRMGKEAVVVLIVALQKLVDINK